VQTLKKHKTSRGGKGKSSNKKYQQKFTGKSIGGNGRRALAVLGLINKV
jgi:hypothetical protein